MKSFKVSSSFIGSDIAWHEGLVVTVKDHDPSEESHKTYASRLSRYVRKCLVSLAGVEPNAVIVAEEIF